MPGLKNARDASLSASLEYKRASADDDEAAENAW